MGENSPEFIAFRLMVMILGVEGYSTVKNGQNPADRKTILDTYAECAFAVRGGRTVARKPSGG